MPARLSSEGLLLDYKIPPYRYYPTRLLPSGTRDWSRVRFLQACERLRIPPDRWPKFKTLTLPGDAHHYIQDEEPFHLPRFDILQDSIEGWRKRTDQAFRAHCENFLKRVSDGIADAVSRGILSKIERHSEKAAPLQLRFEWAARRYCYNEPYKDLSTAVHSPETVRKAVAKVFLETEIHRRKASPKPDSAENRK